MVAAAHIGQLEEGGEQELQAAVRRFAQAGRAVKSLAEKEEGTDTLVPLTGSLYVNGKLGSTDKVLIDIGTGYYLEVRANGGRAAARAMRPSRRAATRTRSVVDESPPAGSEGRGQRTPRVGERLDAGARRAHLHSKRTSHKRVGDRASRGWVGVTRSRRARAGGTTRGRRQTRRAGAGYARRRA